MPNAAVVADRFHVMKIVNQDLDTARKDLRKTNEEHPNELEGRVEAALKQSKYVLLKPEFDWEAKAKLGEIRSAAILSSNASTKEAFRALFERAENWEMAHFNYWTG